MKRGSAVAFLAAGGLCAVASTTAFATDGDDINEVIVTAQKFAEPESKTPVTISALSGAQLTQRNYVGLEDFKGAIPGLQVNNYIGEARINIRGIGTNSLSFGVDPQVAFTLNGVYSTIFSADQAFLDVDRIEALRGPQGTLYGRNATGGAINIISRRPATDYEVSGQLRVGNYGEVAPELVISGPLGTDKLLGRLAVSSEDNRGYSLNLADGRYYDDTHARTIRGTLVYNIIDSLSLTLIGDYHEEYDGNYAAHLFGTSPGHPVITGVAVGGSVVPLDANGQSINPRLLDINTLPENHRHSAGIAAELAWKLSDSLQLKSISAYRNEGLSLTFDFDSTTAVFPSTIPNKDFAAYTGSQQASEELQLVGTNGPVSWVGGLFYFHDHVNPGYYWLGAAPAPASFPVRVGGQLDTDAYAAFGQATYHVTDKFGVIAGVRYSHEQRSADTLELLPAIGVSVPQSGSASFHDVSPKFSLEYQWTSGLLTYLMATKGFQSGGFDISAQPPLASFNQETVWDYEGGVKYRAHGFSADVAAFHYDYRNLQVAQIVDGLPRTTNAATSAIDGVELSTTMKPFRQLTVSGSFAYLDARFDKFTEPDTLTGVVTDLHGNQLPGSTKYSSNVLVQYDIPIGTGQLTVNGEWNWHDRLYFTEFNSKQVSQPAVSTFNAALRYTPQSEHWYAEVFGKNLSNELIRSQAWITGAGFGAMVIGQLAPPRTYGVTLRYSIQ